jgi:hypothetical protein
VSAPNVSHPCRLTSILALAAFAVAGCNGSDAAVADGDMPIAALGVRAPTSRYLHEFWLDQARRGTALWDSAFALCSGYWKQNDGSKPNCGHVYTANFQHSGATTPVRAKNMSVDSLAAR